VIRRRLNRREALGLGAAASPAARCAPGLRFAAGTSLFELALPDEGAHAAGGWRTTHVLAAPRRFDLMGLRWKRGSHLEAQVRARRRGGSWGPWLPLHAAGDHAPDGARAPAGTEPAYTGTADLFQLRLRGSATGLKARFVRAQPTARTARHVTGRLLRRKAKAKPRARKSQSSQPAIITRTEWGGDSVPPRAAPEYGEVQAAFVHHTVSSNDYGPEESRASCSASRATTATPTAGTTSVTTSSSTSTARCSRAARAGIDQAVIGAQAQGYNSSSTGIATIGTFTSVPFPEAGFDALARLIGWKLSLHGVPTQGQVVLTSLGGASNRYPSGTPVTVERIPGHRDGDSTSCPGNMLYAQLPDLRVRASRYAGPLAGISMHASSRRVRTGPVRLSGSLAFPDGSSPAGAPLQIQFAVPGATFARIAGTVCAADGRWSAVGPALPLRLAPRRLPRRRHAPAAGLLPDRDPRPAAAAHAAVLEAPPGRPQRRDLGHDRAQADHRAGRGAVRAQGRAPLAQGEQEAHQGARGRFLTRVRLRTRGLYRISVVTPGATQRKMLRVR
jgi:hypothetical protein